MLKNSSFENNRYKKLKQTYEQNTVAPFILAKVLSSTPVNPGGANASNYCYRYLIRECTINYVTNSKPTITDRNSTQSLTAFSSSELGNTSAVFGYGVLFADLPTAPATFAPVPIPSGSVVVAVPVRNTENSELIYIIINTQAMTGQC